MAINKPGQPGKGRIMKLASVGNFLSIKRGIIMFSCCLNGIVLWGIGLDDNLTP